MELEEEFFELSFKSSDLNFEQCDTSQGDVEFTTQLQASRAVGG